MPEPQDAIRDACNAFWDGMRQIGDFSYAIFPKDVAHALGDLKKSILSQLRSCLERDIAWIDARVAGGDRLREQWREKCQQQTSTEQM